MSNLIEKLEALLKYWNGHKSLPTEDVISILKEAKAEQAEPVGYVDESGLFTKDPYEYPNKSFTPVFLNPQPTPQDILDAERYRWLRNRNSGDVLNNIGVKAGAWIDCENEDGTLVLLTGDDADQAIDRAMKGAND